MKFIALLALFALVYSTQAYRVRLDDFETSLQAWNNLRPNSYTYVHSAYYGEETTVTVTNGKVTRRDYFYRNDYGKVVKKWVEDTPKAIGSHDEGFPALTIDQAYSQCKENILIYGDIVYAVRFETDQRGIISRCDYWNTASSHGTRAGVVIKSLEF